MHTTNVFSKCIIIILILFQIAVSQPTKIAGLVVDMETQQPLAGVNVYLKNQSIGTVTDLDGYFELQVNDQTTEIVFQYIGYKTKTVSTEELSTQRNVIELASEALSIKPIVVTGSVARKDESPVSYTQINQEEILVDYGVSDVPMFLNKVPGVYAYSDNGTGMGYSYMNIRGFDSKRLSVMINGIPHNDPEDNNVYWVDMPDLLESASSLQIQRGVGISPYAVSSFGGSINILTTGIPEENKSSFTYAYGSYNTIKYNTTLNKKINDNYYVSLRLSKMQTDGYRDRSGVDLWSYYLKLIRNTKSSFTQLNIYGGKEITHAAWEYSPESALRRNHKHNPITYHNYIDNFTQPHYELIHMRDISNHLSLKNSLFYIHGVGYYENQKFDRDLYTYNIVSADTGASGDVIRQKWVAKDQAGIVSQLEYHPATNINLNAGIYASKYGSVNWGEIKNLRTSANIVLPADGLDYYRYTHKKDYLNFFLSATVKVLDKLIFTGNLYSQNTWFKFKHSKLRNFAGINRHAYSISYNYMLPKAGITWKVTPQLNIFVSAAKSQREPTANDLFNTWLGPDDLGVAPHFYRADTIYEGNEVQYIEWKNPKVKDEKLTDYEFGIRYNHPKFSAEINAYKMYFKDEIVLTSAVDKDGFDIKGNADNTIHQGVDIMISTNLIPKMNVQFYYSYADNHFETYNQTIYDQNNQVDTVLNLSGNSIAGFPSVLAGANAELDLNVFKTALSYQYRGRIFIDNTENKARSIDPVSRFDLSFTFNPGKMINLPAELLAILQINNLFNKTYFTSGYYDSWAGENYLIPAARRNFLLTFKYLF
ncbi:MAG: TonB-dependent receptor [Calditrichia bacterium]